MSCKLLIHFYLIIIVQCLSSCIVESFVQCPSVQPPFIQSSFLQHPFAQDQELTPSSKYIEIQSVESFIHRRGPSA